MKITMKDKINWRYTEKEKTKDKKKINNLQKRGD